MTDDEVIKRRLLIDGDGTGDDRRLNILLKTFIKWCSTKNDTPENNQIIYDRLLAQLAQCTFAATKSQTIEKMIQQELKNYETLSNTIEASIELANKEIETSKAELVLAKNIRKNRMEYDVLARVIQTQPDREETSKKLEALKTELKNLEEEEIRLNRKLDYRKKNFHLLMHSIRELQSKLDESSSEDEQYEDESIERMSEDEDNFWDEIKSNDVDGEDVEASGEAVVKPPVSTSSGTVASAGAIPIAKPIENNLTKEGPVAPPADVIILETE